MDPRFARPVSSLPVGTALSRYLMLKALGQEQGNLTAFEVARSQMRNTPQVLTTLQDELHHKAAVSAGTSSDAAWANPLVQYGIAAEVLALLRDKSIIGALEPRMRRVPFKVQVARETGSGTGGSWVGEGFATPVMATAYDSVFQEAFKCGTIVVLSKELLKLGDPVAERVVRETVVAGVAAFLDAQFLTNTVTLVANLRPAAITNGATAVVSTGATAAAIGADLAALVAAITTNGSGLTWIMRKKTLATIAGALGAASGLPATLYGLPVIASDNSPAQITLVDAAQILYSDDGEIALDATEEAAIQMDSAPTTPPVAATTVVSLWHHNLWGLRAMRYIAYLPARSGAVSYMLTSY